MQRIERHAARIYTRSIFVKFQKELHHSGAYSVEEVFKGMEYIVKREMDHKDIEYYRTNFRIEVDRNDTFNCICKKVNRDGILCCHVLRLFTQLGINEIPEKYIKDRWTKSYQETELDLQKKVFADGSERDRPLLRHAMMMKSISDMCSGICRDKEKSIEFMNQVQFVL